MYRVAGLSPELYFYSASTSVVLIVKKSFFSYTTKRTFPRMKLAKISAIKCFFLSIVLASTFAPISRSEAAWSYLGTDQDGPFYIETTTITKVKGFVVYELLFDYTKAGRSSVSLVQADCSLRRIKLLQAKAYPRPMANGLYKTSKPVPRWVLARGNTVIETVLSFVCQ